MRHIYSGVIASLVLLCGSAKAQTLAERLKLTAAQQPLFAAWEMTRQGDPKQLRALSSQELASHTAPTYTESQLAWAEYRLEWSRRAVSSAHDLYAALTSAQRIMFDAVVLPKTEKDAPPIDPLPKGGNSVAADPNAPERTTPNWSRIPDGEEFVAFYPPAAYQEGKAGKAAITCAVTTMGIAAGCVVDHEEPSGYGFGNASIEIVSAFRFHPATFYGVPVMSEVTIPLSWKLETYTSKLASEK